MVNMGKRLSVVNEANNNELPTNDGKGENNRLFNIFSGKLD